ncbi:hypothetical protein OH77DRAFT_1585693 [Trametes cingulata]|nr:hypothetical protein OH77DRAFT_1585693 [Trametes cingulata]
MNVELPPPSDSAHRQSARSSKSTKNVQRSQRAVSDDDDVLSSSSAGGSLFGSDNAGSDGSSDSESDGEPEVGEVEGVERKDGRNARTEKRTALVDSSDDEERTGRGGKGGKHHRNPQPRGEGESTDERRRKGGTKAPRFNWSSGDGARAHDYLASRYHEWAQASREDRPSVLKRAAEHVVTTYTFPKHNAGDVREAVTTWFRNQRSALKRGAIQVPGQRKPKNNDKTLTTVSEGVKEEPDVTPFLKVIKGRATAAAHLWARANVDIVNAELNDNNIGERQRVVAQLFKALPKSEQDEWRAKAKLAHEEVEQNPDQCFENQQGFSGILARLLNQFVGFGPGGVGAVIMHVRMAMREKDGSVYLANLTVGGPDGHPTFADFEGGADVNEQRRWDRFLDSALPPNPSRRDPRLQYADDGTPSLPSTDNTWTQSDMASTLAAYYQAIWAHGQGNKVAAPALDWEAIRTTPDVYLEPSWVEKGIADPSTLDFFGIAVAYKNILAAQRENQPFRFREAPQGERAAAQTRTAPTAAGRSLEGHPTTARENTQDIEQSNPRTPSHRPRIVVYRTPEKGGGVLPPRTLAAASDKANGSESESNHPPSLGSVLFAVPEESEPSVGDQGLLLGDDVDQVASETDAASGVAGHGKRREEDDGEVTRRLLVAADEGLNDVQDASVDCAHQEGAESPMPDRTPNQRGRVGSHDGRGGEDACVSHEGDTPDSRNPSVNTSAGDDSGSVLGGPDDGRTGPGVTAAESDRRASKKTVGVGAASGRIAAKAGTEDGTSRLVVTAPGNAASSPAPYADAETPPIMLVSDNAPSMDVWGEGEGDATGSREGGDAGESVSSAPRTGKPRTAGAKRKRADGASNSAHEPFSKRVTRGSSAKEAAANAVEQDDVSVQGAATKPVGGRRRGQKVAADTAAPPPRRSKRAAK